MKSQEGEKKTLSGQELQDNNKCASFVQREFFERPNIS